MPRKTSGGAASADFQFQKQAQALLASLHKKILEREAELKRLKDHASSLSGIVGVSRRAHVPSAGAAAPSVGGGRINWRTVLQQMPKQFKASDVRGVRGLKGKRPSEIFAAITRWIDAGMAKRKARGVYERV